MMQAICTIMIMNECVWLLAESLYAMYSSCAMFHFFVTCHMTYLTQQLFLYYHVHTVTLYIQYTIFIPYTYVHVHS